MNDFFNYSSSDKEDFYVILGCSQHSNSDQILMEYKKKVISCHPDKNPNDVTAHERFELLKQAKDTLIDIDLRKVYDRWYNSGRIMPWTEWLNRSRNHQMMFHWTIKKPDPMIQDKIELRPDEEKVKMSHFSDSPDEVLQKFRNYQI